MQKIDFGGGVIKSIGGAPRQTRELIDPNDVIEAVKVTFTIVEAFKVLIVTIKRLFKK